MSLIFKCLMSLGLITIFSCNEKKEESQWKKDHEKSMQQDTLNLKESDALRQRLNAVSLLDTSIKFTYQLQDLSKNKPIQISGIIQDIIKKDSNYIMIVYSQLQNKRYIAHLVVSHEQLQKMNLEVLGKYTEGCFIFSLTNVSSTTLLQINSEIYETETIEEAESYLTYNFNRGMILFKGNLVDFYMYKD